eukprot:TRINITY_DN3120_c0_g1_i2.p1 TRINITY_DN3120_c0_g1~~TRINITY_DN3120_c0_g1_i2.p1  ORF type:complete len:398 (-),score=57.53 TRINITY_DN3120_c0_g1_i2:263-1456(-)
MSAFRLALTHLARASRTSSVQSIGRILSRKSAFASLCGSISLPLQRIPAHSFSTSSGDASEQVSQLLHNLCRLKESNKGFAVYDKAVSMGIELSTEDYNAVFGMAASGTPEDALRAFDEVWPAMKAAGVKPNQLTYALLARTIARRCGKVGGKSHSSRTVGLEQGLQLCDEILGNEAFFAEDAQPLGEVDPWGRETLTGFHFLMRLAAFRRMEPEAYKVFRCLQALGISADDDCYDFVRLAATLDYSKQKFPKSVEDWSSDDEDDMTPERIKQIIDVSPSTMYTNHPTAITHNFELGGFGMRQMQLRAQSIDAERVEILAEIKRLDSLDYTTPDDKRRLASGTLRWASPTILTTWRDSIVERIEPGIFDAKAEFERLRSERKLLETPRDPRKTEFEL